MTSYYLEAAWLFSLIVHAFSSFFSCIESIPHPLCVSFVEYCTFIHSFSVIPIANVF